MSPNTWPVIDAGVRALEKGTCLQFVDYTNQKDYIGNFRRFSACKIHIMNDNITYDS